MPLIDFIEKMLHPYRICFWMPAKDTWVIQATWNHDLESVLRPDELDDGDDDMILDFSSTPHLINSSNNFEFDSGITTRDIHSDIDLDIKKSKFMNDSDYINKIKNTTFMDDFTLTKLFPDSFPEHSELGEDVYKKN